MNIPVFQNVRYVNNDGYLTPEIQVYEDNLNRVFQGGLSDNGWTLPQVTTANIALVAPNMPNGTLWYDSDLDQIKAKVAGVVVVIYP